MVGTAYHIRLVRIIYFPVDYDFLKVFAYFLHIFYNILPKEEYNIVNESENKHLDTMIYTPEQAKDKVLSLLSEVQRPGIEKLIEFVKTSNYLTDAHCNKHHHCKFGLLMHSLEVLDVMVNNNFLGLPRESLIIVALGHDLGKACMNNRKVGSGNHWNRSTYILDKCGFALTDNERHAIKYHHSKSLRSFANPLKALLNLGDCESTRLYKKGVTYSFTRV